MGGGGELPKPPPHRHARATGLYTNIIGTQVTRLLHVIIVIIAVFGIRVPPNLPRCKYVRAVFADLTWRPGNGKLVVSNSLDNCILYSSIMAAGISTLDLSTTGRRFMPSAASKCLSAWPASLNAALAPDGLGVSPHTMPVITATINSTPLIIVDQAPAKMRSISQLSYN